MGRNDQQDVSSDEEFFDAESASLNSVDISAPAHNPSVPDLENIASEAGDAPQLKLDSFGASEERSATPTSKDNVTLTTVITGQEETFIEVPNQLERDGTVKASEFQPLGTTVQQAEQNPTKQDGEQQGEEDEELVRVANEIKLSPDQQAKQTPSTSASPNEDAILPAAPSAQKEAVGASQRDANDNTPPPPVAPPRRRRGNRHTQLADIDPEVADIHKRPQRSTTPTEEEILSNVLLTCLDTGESVPLAEAELLLPKGIDPLSLHVIRLTGEFAADKDIADHEDAQEDTENGKKQRVKAMLRTAKKKTMAAAAAASSKAKALGEKATTLLGDDEKLKEEQERAEEAAGYVKMRTKNSKSVPGSLRHLRCVQEMGKKDTGAVWTMKFSSCGRLLATAGQDQFVRVWVLKKYYDHFAAMRQGDSKPGADDAADGAAASGSDSEGPPSRPSSGGVHDQYLFHPEPFCEYEGHKGDVLDLSWSLSKNFFLLSSSMDKTVRLWHISRDECLACFLHEDFVTAIAFHPRNDKYFLSGSLDCKLRLWNIPEKKVALWNEVGSEGCNLITAANFCSGGKYAVAGTYDGRCVFFNTEERLKYHTQIHARSTRGKNSKGRKISGIEPMPGSDKILVTSNDSRIRLYDLKDHSLRCKYRGATNTSSQIKATFSPDGNAIICGSEDHRFYTWSTEPTQGPGGTFKKGWRRDRNDDYQRFSAHAAVVTVALFAPPLSQEASEENSGRPELLLSADYNGCIKVYVAEQVSTSAQGRGGNGSGSSSPNSPELSGGRKSSTEPL